VGFFIGDLMKDNNTQLLKVSYPTVFKENFYFECEDGWLHLIQEIAMFISSRTDKCQAAQVKEKFGTLRFYIDCVEGLSEETYKEIAEYISAVERLSYYVCEYCGTKIDDTNRAKNTSYWIKNICVPCKQKEDLQEEEAMMRKAWKANK
jgi:hypothetical protein